MTKPLNKWGGGGNPRKYVPSATAKMLEASTHRKHWEANSCRLQLPISSAVALRILPRISPRISWLHCMTHSLSYRTQRTLNEIVIPETTAPICPFCCGAGKGQTGHLDHCFAEGVKAQDRSREKRVFPKASKSVKEILPEFQCLHIRSPFRKARGRGGRRNKQLATFERNPDIL